MNKIDIHKSYHFFLIHLTIVWGPIICPALYWGLVRQTGAQSPWSLIHCTEKTFVKPVRNQDTRNIVFACAKVGLLRCHQRMLCGSAQTPLPSVLHLIAGSPIHKFSNQWVPSPVISAVCCPHLIFASSSLQKYYSAIRKAGNPAFVTRQHGLTLRALC